MTAITIERELLEQALDALSAPNHRVFSEPKICLNLRAALSAPATAPEPSWQDAPTVPGLWVVDEKLWRITKPELHEGSEDRWFGPLPEDKP